MENISRFRQFYNDLPERNVVAPKANFIRRIADLCLVTPQTVRMWLYGQQKPDSLKRSIIAKETGIPENELFND